MKLVYIIIGCIGVILGAIGAVLPLLPAFPFLLIAAICFGKSSKKLNHWFIGTSLYKNNLESFVLKKGMTIKVKLRIIALVTITMAFGFVMMDKVPIGRIILGIIWIFHLVYFIFGIQTVHEE